MNIQPRSLTRREAVQRMLAAAAAMQVMGMESYGVQGLPKTIGMDPKLHEKVIPWDRLLTEAELKTVTVLGDAIIPADDQSPAASAVGIPDFINEWVSAPYPAQLEDRVQLREGFVWLDQESQKRFQKNFADLAEPQVTAICDDICSAERARPEFKQAASFFAKMRNLVAGGFYSTPEGWKDIGFIGNVPMVEFPGPPPEVLKHVGLA